MTSSRYREDQLGGAARSIVAVTPNDSTDLGRATRGLYVGTAGNVSIIPAYDDQTAVIFYNVPAGTVLPVSAIRVRATGTTASNIVALA